MSRAFEEWLRRTLVDLRRMQGGSHTVTLQIPEAKSQLRVAMSTWPMVDEVTAQFLRRLHWRIRRCVILTHGEELSREQVAARLRVSVRTVTEDLQRAYDAYEEALRGQFN